MHPSAAALELLPWAEAQLKASRESIPAVINRLNHALCAARASLSSMEWASLIEECRRHPVCGLLLEDPLTRRSFTKPRGYPGDAGLLDIIYSQDWRSVCPEPASAHGAAIFSHTIRCQAPAAVRHRRELLAAMIDEVCARKSNAEILSVACGHLRELDLSHAMTTGRVNRFVGLDQDRDSLAVVEAQWRQRGIETLAGSIKLLWSAELRDQRFDFIYTAGLYDYLADSLAQRLTLRMFEMLRPGGRLLVANYHPSITDVGYMETFMDWKLLYRDEAAMERIAARLPEALLAGKKLFADPSGAVLYLQLERV